MRLFTLHGAQERASRRMQSGVRRCALDVDALGAALEGQRAREIGEPVVCTEWIPYLGTRAEFMMKFREQFELWMPHVHRDRVLKFMLRLQAEHMTSPEQMEHPTVGNMRTDFAAAIEIIRMFSATCAFAHKDDQPHAKPIPHGPIP